MLIITLSIHQLLYTKYYTFNFSQSTLNMSDQDSGIIKVDKIQETSTTNLILCLNRFLNIYKKENKKFIQNCTTQNLDNVFKEIYKRLLIPLYIPTLILVSLLLMSVRRTPVAICSVVMSLSFEVI